MIRSIRPLLCMFILTAVVGCSPGMAKVPTFSASGQLTVDDKPFAGPATITLSNTDTTTKGAPSLSGTVDKDGKIKFTAYGQEGYVAAGTYNVTLAGDIMNMSVKVPATEPTVVEIKQGASSVDIILKSIPGAAPVGGLAPPKI